jgi:GNAT superfamily N-acetyltransferase
VWDIPHTALSAITQMQETMDAQHQQAIIDTEMRLLEPICDFIPGDGYRVFRSERFPNYYGGNGIDILELNGRKLADWESISKTYFDPNRFKHTTYCFAWHEIFTELMQEAVAAGYHVERSTLMDVDHMDNCRLPPPEFEIMRVVSEDDWLRFQRFEEADYFDQDWYDPDYTGPNRLFEKTRFTSEAIGIDWYYLRERGEEEMLAKLGIFMHNGVARLQDVRTARTHRRLGLASYLVSFAIEHALTTLGAGRLALLADLDYYAIDLYRKLGFRDVGEHVTLMKYPVVNPAYVPEQ